MTADHWFYVNGVDTDSNGNKHYNCGFYAPLVYGSSGFFDNIRINIITGSDHPWSQGTLTYEQQYYTVTCTAHITYSAISSFPMRKTDVIKVNGGKLTLDLKGFPAGWTYCTPNTSATVAANSTVSLGDFATGSAGNNTRRGHGHYSVAWSISQKRILIG